MRADRMERDPAAGAAWTSPLLRPFKKLLCSVIFLCARESIMGNQWRASANQRRARRPTRRCNATRRPASASAQAEGLLGRDAGGDSDAAARAGTLRPGPAGPAASLVRVCSQQPLAIYPGQIHPSFFSQPMCWSANPPACRQPASPRSNSIARPGPRDTAPPPGAPRPARADSTTAESPAGEPRHVTARPARPSRYGTLAGATAPLSLARGGFAHGVSAVSRRDALT
jgi:hypothetical protein